MPYLSRCIMYMGDHGAGWKNEARGEEFLSILDRQDRVGEMVGVRVLDCVKH